MKQRVIPREAFPIALLVGFAIQASVFGHPTLQDGAPQTLGWMATALSLYVAPYILFFLAAGGGANRLVGLAAVLSAGAMMYALFRYVAPTKLTLSETALALVGWVAGSLFFVLALASFGD